MLACPGTQPRLQGGWVFVYIYALRKSAIEENVYCADDLGWRDAVGLY